MKREEGRIGVLAELGEVAAPERSVAADEAGAARFSSSVQALKGRRARPRRRLVRAAAVGAGLAVAAALAVTLGSRSTERGKPASPDEVASTSSVEIETQESEPTRIVDAEGREWLETTGEDTVVVRMVSGARAMVGPSSKAWCWSEPTPSWLHLELGQVDVSVPHLRLGQSLTVHTPNASVIVHGTAFTVQVIGMDPPVTTVVVREGTVEVREGGSFTFVHAGEVWRSGSRGSASPKATSEAVVATPGPPVASSRTEDRRQNAPVARRLTASTSAGESSLARENALFREANEAKQRGDFETSQSVLANLLSEFPRSPLRASALVERAFALSRLGRSNEAAAVAKQALSEGAAEHVRERLWQIAFGASPDGSGR